MRAPHEILGELQDRAEYMARFLKGEFGGPTAQSIVELCRELKAALLSPRAYCLRCGTQGPHGACTPPKGCEHCGTVGDHYCPHDVEKGSAA